MVIALGVGCGLLALMFMVAFLRVIELENETDKETESLNTRIANMTSELIEVIRASEKLKQERDDARKSDAEGRRKLFLANESRDELLDIGEGLAKKLAEANEKIDTLTEYANAREQRISDLAKDLKAMYEKAALSFNSVCKTEYKTEYFATEAA